MTEWINILLLTLGLFILTLLLVRLIGKRQTSRMTLFDLTTAIVIGVMVALISLKLVKPISGLVALAVWVGASIGVYFLAIKLKWLRDIVQGKETILINHGKVLEDKLLEVRYTPEDLLGKLREKGAFKVADVEFAILEPNGEVSVMLKKQQQPLTANSVGLPVGAESVPQTVMLDGEILDEPLAAMGLNRQWLLTELEKSGVAKANVFVAQVDSAGQLYLDLFDDAIQVPQPKTKELIFATLKKCQSDCELYALATKQQTAKAMYQRSAQSLSGVINELLPLLKR